VKFVFGLGNPGRQYAKTRHNIGFAVIDRVADRCVSGPFRPKLKAEHVKVAVGGASVILAKPQTFMNLSGEAVRDILGFYKGTAGDLLVVHDDLDLPLGTLRFREGGGTGGHRGIASTVDALGTGDFNRLKFGIGRDPQRDPADFVLGRFEAECRDDVERGIASAADAVLSWIREGFPRSAERFNRSKQEDSHDKEEGA
jgi:PTH1 family peptidyl-tRNA hydrolase